ncbi:hypothetical protein RRG08_012994 [Elysia crispata]|uniref:Uncharacterized protein n=1 Tax=Elysia crispata TaxID=231223 RepID=A0AAE1DR84_9GAST|nr:hypothetical protein RRG08_012994 [Elysia crispata]
MVLYRNAQVPNRRVQLVLRCPLGQEHPQTGGDSNRHSLRPAGSDPFAGIQAMACREILLREEQRAVSYWLLLVIQSASALLLSGARQGQRADRRRWTYQARICPVIIDTVLSSDSLKEPSFSRSSGSGVTLRADNISDKRTGVTASLTAAHLCYIE